MIIKEKKGKPLMGKTRRSKKMNKIQVSQFSRRLRTYFLQELITHCSSLTQMTPTCFEREKEKIQVHVFFYLYFYVG